MKKILLILALFLISNAGFAQWTTIGSNIYYNSGNAGIGFANNPLSLFQVGPANSQTNLAFDMIFGKGTALGNTAGLYSYMSEYQENTTTNVNRLQTALYRRIAGTGWQGTAYRLQYAVDNSFTDGSKAFVELGGDDPNVSGGGFIALGTGGSDRLVVTSAGGVGIGTTNPKGYLLAVNGSAIATSMTVKANANWPDYVFKSNYRLPDIAGLKTYINQNHHLPDFPSADQVAKYGLNLGEINILLTKKVEELTLYMIEKDKKETEQQEQIDVLQKQIKLQQESLKTLQATVQKLVGAETKN